jgi:hypothetical protein
LVMGHFRSGLRIRNWGEGDVLEEVIDVLDCLVVAVVSVVAV